jgi:hypothetical protein
VVGVLVEGHSGFGSVHPDVVEVDALPLEVVVVLEGHGSGVELVVGRPVALFEAGVLLVLALAALEHPAEVEPGEDAVVGHDVVLPVGLEVVVVLEAGGVGVAQEEREEGVAIIDGVEFLAVHEVLQVMLYYWFLVDSSSLSSSGVNINTITKGKNVIVFFVLKGIWVNTDHTSFVGKTCINQFLLGLAGGVNDSREEVLFNSFSGIDISEYCNLLSMGIMLNFNHFLTEVDVNISLATFFENNIVSVGELVDFLVRGPELDSSVFSRSSL